MIRLACVQETLYKESVEICVRFIVHNYSISNAGSQDLVTFDSFPQHSYTKYECYFLNQIQGELNISSHGMATFFFQIVKRSRRDGRTMNKRLRQTRVILKQQSLRGNFCERVATLREMHEPCISIKCQPAKRVGTHTRFCLVSRSIF